MCLLSVCKKRKMLYSFLTDVVNGKILGKGQGDIDPIVDVLRENEIEMLANRFMGKLDCENTRIMVNYKKTGYEFETRRKQVVQCRFKAQKKSGKDTETY